MPNIRSEKKKVPKRAEKFYFYILGLRVYEGMRVLKVKVISLPYIFQVLYVLCCTRPRYQVSVYWTIGPLVYFLPYIGLREKWESP